MLAAESRTLIGITSGTLDVQRTNREKCAVGDNLSKGKLLDVRIDKVANLLIRSHVRSAIGRRHRVVFDIPNLLSSRVPLTRWRRVVAVSETAICCVVPDRFPEEGTKTCSCGCD
jgi:hypothetical protein